LYGGKYKRFESEIPIEFRVIGCWGLGHDETWDLTWQMQGNHECWQWGQKLLSSYSAAGFTYCSFQCIVRFQLIWWSISSAILPFFSIFRSFCISDFIFVFVKSLLAWISLCLPCRRHAFKSCLFNRALQHAESCLSEWLRQADYLHCHDLFRSSCLRAACGLGLGCDAADWPGNFIGVFLRPTASV
jgi:hypothetical protein